MPAVHNPKNFDNIYKRPTSKRKSTSLDAILESNDEGNDVQDIFRSRDSSDIPPDEPIGQDNSSGIEEIILSKSENTEIKRLRHLELMTYDLIKGQLSGTKEDDGKLAALISAHSNLIKNIKVIKDMEVAHDAKLCTMMPAVFAVPIYDTLLSKIQAKLESFPARVAGSVAYQSGQVIRERIDKEVADIFSGLRQDIVEIIQELREAQTNYVSSVLDESRLKDDDGNMKDMSKNVAVRGV